VRTLLATVAHTLLTPSGLSAEELMGLQRGYIPFAEKLYETCLKIYPQSWQAQAKTHVQQALAIHPQAGEAKALLEILGQTKQARRRLSGEHRPHRGIETLTHR